MYQLRKFDFFEEKYGGKIPEDVTGGIQCCSSGRGKVVIGSNDGSVSFLDRGIKFDSGFQAHSSSVLFIQHLKQRNFLVTVREDEQILPQQSGMCLMVFDLYKVQEESLSSSVTECIGILRIFTKKISEAKCHQEYTFNSGISDMDTSSLSSTFAVPAYAPDKRISQLLV